MGMTLKLDDLRAALLMPKELAVGFILQYTVTFFVLNLFAFSQWISSLLHVR